MGSLFYINVPTREHEVLLRQQALQILVEKEIPNVNKSLLVSALRIQTTESIRNQVAGAHTKPSTVSYNAKAKAGGSTTPGLLRTLSNATEYETSRRNSVLPSESSVDVYEVTVKGKKANIVVSQDSMLIYPYAIPITSQDDKKTKELSGAMMDQLQKSVIENTFLERHLEDALATFLIYDATWAQSVDGNFSQVSFTVQDFRTENIINFLLNLGIGTKYDSTLGVCSAVVYYNPNKQDSKDTPPGREHKESFGSQFIASIKSRLTVAQVVQSVESNAIISFDFILLLTIAAIIAGFGLLENSAVNIVASMLISPLMGPIMAGCFGTVVRDKKLLKTGVISELVGLSACLIIGFIFGVSVTSAPFPGPWSKIKHWPTSEMVGRGSIRGMAVSAMVAIPSGAGVALGILGGNAGSLVGVAISASLLPPAVNCGMFLGMSAVISIKTTLDGFNPFQTPCGEYIGNISIDHHYRLTHENYGVSDFYCKNVVKEYGVLGIASFGLTIVNIVLILFSGYLILKLKEVAPHTSRKTMMRFWKQDLKVMREYNKTHGTFTKQALLAEIGGSRNAAQIRERLAEDAVFKQVARRNVFGSQIGAHELLEGQYLSSDDSIQTTASLVDSQPTNGTGWFSWFSGSGTKIVEPKALTPKTSTSKKGVPPRPKLQYGI